MRGQIINAQRQSGFHGGDAPVHHHAHWHAAQAQGDEFGKGDLRAGEQGADVDHAEVQDEDAHHENHQAANAVEHQVQFTAKGYWIERGLYSCRIMAPVPRR